MAMNVVTSNRIREHASAIEICRCVRKELNIDFLLSSFQLINDCNDVTIVPQHAVLRRIWIAEVRLQQSLLCNRRLNSGVMQRVYRQRIGKHVPAATVTHTAGETGCCLRGPRRGIIKKRRIGQPVQLRSAREDEKRRATRRADKSLAL
jgi:hypothetical protein